MTEADERPDPLGGGGGAPLRPGAAAVPRPVARPGLAEPRRARLEASVRRRWAGVSKTRLRLGLGVSLVLVLAIGLTVTRGGPASPEPVPTPPRNAAGSSITSRSGADPASSTTTSAAPARAVVAVPSWIPSAFAATCGAWRADRVVHVECTPGRGIVTLHYRALPNVTAMRAAYGALAPRGGADGAPACAQGRAEERSWSWPARPATVEGRYRCTIGAGHARLVWSSDRLAVVAEAERGDTDLRSLYAWWAAEAGPVDSGHGDGP